MTNELPDSLQNQRIDRFGAVASTLCAVHCAICALLPAAFGVLGLGMLLSQEAEWAFTIVAVAIAAVASIMNWRQHRSYVVAGLLTLGIVGLLSSRVLEMGSGHHHGDEHHEEGHHGEEHQVEGSSVDEKKLATNHSGEEQDQEHESHLSEQHNDDHHDEQGEHHDEHSDDSESHSDTKHLVGASLGFLGGMLLFFGHLMNIRTSRENEPKVDCCD